VYRRIYEERRARLARRQEINRCRGRRCPHSGQDIALAQAQSCLPFDRRLSRDRYVILNGLMELSHRERMPVAFTIGSSFQLARLRSGCQLTAIARPP
jgi:hypothetical protein